MSVNFSVRIDENLKKQSFAVIEEYGLTPSQVVKMVFRQIAKTHAIPLSLSYQANEPNETTKQAILQSRADSAAGKLETYEVNSVAEFNAVMEKIRNE
ncbi:MAG: type II toxin-antitoxin system RelB/DinJ family antitoxin [Neisseriaceae bacterium]|nr:type II toxin-antitoxin system RelB/DinJ family antitoxin [Neisseriaceae bacterium]